MYLNKYDDVVIYANFLSYEEEDNVINKLKKNNFEQVVASDHIQNLSQKLFDQGIVNKLPDAVSINEYFPGQGTEPHIDPPDYGDVVTILGVGSYTILNFSNREKHDFFQVYFPERAIVQIKNEIRNEWEYWIEDATCDMVGGLRMERSKRYSIVFRHLKK